MPLFAPPLREVETRAESGRRGLAPLSVRVPPERALAVVAREANRKRGWTVVKLDAPRRTVTIEARVPFVRTADDVVLEIEPHDGGGSSIRARLRSHSAMAARIGGARRLRSFLRRLRAAFEAELEGSP